MRKVDPNFGKGQLFVGNNLQTGFPNFSRPLNITHFSLFEQCVHDPQVNVPTPVIFYYLQVEKP